VPVFREFQVGDGDELLGLLADGAGGAVQGQLQRGDGAGHGGELLHGGHGVQLVRQGDAAAFLAVTAVDK
jgi:hypothetical protein